MQLRAWSNPPWSREEESNAENQPTGHGPMGWLEKGPSASLFVRYVSHRICSSLTPRIQTLLKPTVCLLLMTRCTTVQNKFALDDFPWWPLCLCGESAPPRPSGTVHATGGNGFRKSGHRAAFLPETIYGPGLASGAARYQSLVPCNWLRQ